MLKFVAKVSALVIVVFGLAAPPAMATTCTVGGAGTALDPYIICDEASFEGMASHKTSHYKLGADIDLSTRSVASFDFNGELDGAGHSILNYTATLNGSYNGLFTVLNSAGNIHDLQLKNINVTVGADSSYVGPLVGRSYGAVSRVQVTGTMTTSSIYSGTIIGLMFSGSTLTDSVSKVNLTAIGDVIYEGGITSAMLPAGGAPPRMSRVLYEGQIYGSVHGAGLYVLWTDEQGNASCGGHTDSYSVAQTHSNNLSSLCNSFIDPTDLATATRFTTGFTNYSQDVWSFGDASSYPSLLQFPESPGRPKGLGVFPAPAGLKVTVVAGWDGGSTITGYEVEYRDRSGDWSSVGVTAVGPNIAITGLNPETSYQVRARVTTAVGSGPWYYSEGWARTQDPLAVITHTEPRLLEAIVPNRNMSDPLLLPSGNIAYVNSYFDAAGVTNLVATVVDKDGNEIVRGPVAANQSGIENGQANAIKVFNLPFGRIGVIWNQSDQRNASALNNRLMFSSSSTGLIWSTPVSITPDWIVDPLNNDCRGLCAYENVSVAVTPTGGIVVATTKPVGTNSTSNLEVYSSTNGTTWVAPAAPIRANSNFRNVDAVATNGAVLVGWSAHRGGEGYDTQYSTLKTVGTNKWSTVKTAYTIANASNRSKWLLKGGNVVTMVLMVEQPVGKYMARNLDVVKGKWTSKLTDVFTTTELPQNFDAAISSTGELAIIADTASAGNQRRFSYAKLPAGAKVASQPVLVYSGADTIWGLRLALSPNGTPVFYWLQQLATSNSDWLPKFTLLIGDSVTAAETLPIATGSTYVTSALILPDGDLNFYTQGNTFDYKTELELVKYHTGLTPTIGNQTITGTVKAGKKLVATLPGVASYTKVLTKTFQWYACTSPLPEQTTEIPSQCTAISKATKAAFKIPKTLKGKYLAYAITTTNVTGSRVSMSRTTTAVQ